MALLFLAVSCVQLRNAAIPNGAKIIGVPVALLCAFGWPLMMLVALSWLHRDTSRQDCHVTEATDAGLRLPQSG
ncbi:hypothetical protein GS982_31110 [Rhodococcus hoagii]|nr:hypothetical protein [Prescottella equi]